MNRKIARSMEPPRKRAVSSREVVALLQEGRLTRRQFEAWNHQRRPPTMGIVVAMPDTPPGRPRRRHKHRRAS